MTKRKRLFGIPLLVLTPVILLLISGSGYQVYQYTSSDQYCTSCHVHPQATSSWEKSIHHQDSVQAHCIDCHLPPQGTVEHYTQKVRTGVRDVYSFYFKDSTTYNWSYKSQLEEAVNHTFKTSCINCHENLFEQGQSKEADEAHLYYSYNQEEMHCINCHLDAGHYSIYGHEQNRSFTKIIKADTIYTIASKVQGFKDFEEKIPGTSVHFSMIAIPGGSFKMGSEHSNIYAQMDELPSRKVRVDSMYMGRLEVTWDEYLTFLSDTESEGRVSTEKSIDTDAISGATPPWGDPSQGWGMGSRPAITMTYHAAETYCKWLSGKTGKTYRLPTEAEWEYACRAGSESDYFFSGEPSQFESGFSFFKKKRENEINDYVVFEQNSMNKTQDGSSIKANNFGLVNMLGNVKEFCSDFYREDTYRRYIQNTENPTGPKTGKERVIRGGSFRSSYDEVRCASRDHTRHDAWLKTDPQIPKSIWWYSDCNDVGFRVVCEFDEKTGKGGEHD